MSQARKDTTPIAVDQEQIEFRFADLDGYTVGFETFKVDADPAPLFQGLPDDRCQCPHWGYVLTGKIVHRYADHDETYEAGDAFYSPPGHVPLVTAGTQIIEFSPTDELAKTQQVVSANMQAATESG
jgi:hypothetical protein